MSLLLLFLQCTIDFCDVDDYGDDVSYVATNLTVEAHWLSMI